MSNKIDKRVVWAKGVLKQHDRNNGWLDIQRVNIFLIAQVILDMQHEIEQLESLLEAYKED